MKPGDAPPRPTPPPAEAIPLSAVNQYLYCPRRCALIHLEQTFLENIHTQQGRREHETVDEIGHQVDHGTRVERALPIWSDRMGLRGIADLVELRPDGSVYPVEHKHGPRRRWVNDDAQLCAQALCLEEMFGVSVLVGAIFHRGSRRRREVRFTDELRGVAERAALAVHDILVTHIIPPPVLHPRCRECSLKPACLPEITDATVTSLRLFVPRGDRCG